VIQCLIANEGAAMNAALASDLAGAAGTLAGLILVFLGATSSAFDAYDAVQQNSVRNRYYARARAAFFGFLLALVSCGFAIGGQWYAKQGLVIASMVALGAAVLFVLVVAWQSLQDMR
jgi:hypothetical protein